MSSDVLDHTLCQEMAKYVEELTTSGRPVLNPDIMKSFKKICRISSLYCEHAYHLLISQLEKGHSEIRLSAFQMIEELFERSHCFRELLVANFQHFLELTVETDYDHPLPPPKTAAELLKSTAYSSIQKWYDKFGEEYKRLTLGFNFLKTCKKIDFNGIRARSEVQQRLEREKEEKRKKIADERIQKTVEQMNELMDEIKSAILEAQTGFQLVLPSPDDFFIDSAEEKVTSLGSVKHSEDKTKNNSANCSILNHESQEKIETKTNTQVTCDLNRNLESESCHSQNQNTSCNNSKGRQFQEENKSMTALPHLLSDTSLSNNESLSLIKSDDKVNYSPTRHGQSTNTCDSQKVICEEVSENKGANSSASINMNDVCSSNDSEEEEDADESNDEVEENVLQHHGLANRKYNLSIEVTPGVISLQETEDNTDILQTLKDHYRLIVTKYKPTVNKWLQNLTKYGNNEEMTKGVIDVKTQLDNLLSKYHEMNIIPDDKPSAQNDDDSDDDFEDVPEKEGYEPVIPPHKRAEYGLEPLVPSSSTSPVQHKPKPAKTRTSGFWSLSSTVEQKPEDDPTTIKANLLRLQQNSSSTCSYTDKSSKSKVTLTGDPKKDNLLKQAPVVPFGADLEHWENPDKMEAPLVIKYDDLNVVWASNNDFSESSTDKESLAALKQRTISFVGKFEPVKWKCRAPMPNGKLCERMDRSKCPFHGKIIARNDQGQPTDPKDIAALSGQHDDIDITSNDQSYWRDPELEADIEAALGVDLGSGKGKSKGKGKGKGKQTKYPNLTDITQVNNTSRNRLEKKIFKRSAMKKVAAAMDELDNKKARDKFGNQFVYQMSQR